MRTRMLMTARACVRVYVCARARARLHKVRMRMRENDAARSGCSASQWCSDGGGGDAQNLVYKYTLRSLPLRLHQA